MQTDNQAANNLCGLRAVECRTLEHAVNEKSATSFQLVKQSLLSRTGGIMGFSAQQKGGSDRGEPLEVANSDAVLC